MEGIHSRVKDLIMQIYKDTGEMIEGVEVGWDENDELEMEVHNVTVTSMSFPREDIDET